MATFVRHPTEDMDIEFPDGMDEKSIIQAMDGLWREGQKFTQPMPGFGAIAKHVDVIRDRMDKGESLVDISKDRFKDLGELFADKGVKFKDYVTALPERMNKAQQGDETEAINLMLELFAGSRVGPGQGAGVAGSMLGMTGIKNLGKEATLNEFKRLEKTGALTEEELYAKTMMRRDKDGKIRYVISDKDSKLISAYNTGDVAAVSGRQAEIDRQLRNKSLSESERKALSDEREVNEFFLRSQYDTGDAYLPLEQLMEHNQLYKALPDLKKTPTRIKSFATDKEWEEYAAQNNINKLTKAFVGKDGKITVFSRPGDTIQDIQKRLGHEVQHKIQDIEGHTPGGSNKEAKQRVIDEYTALKQELEDAVKDDPKLAEKLNPQIERVKKFVNDAARMTDDEVYQRLLGEAQARSTADQWFMTESEMKATPYWKNYTKFETRRPMPEEEAIPTRADPSYRGRDSKFPSYDWLLKGADV